MVSKFRDRPEALGVFRIVLCITLLIQAIQNHHFLDFYTSEIANLNADSIMSPFWYDWVSDIANNFQIERRDIIAFIGLTYIGALIFLLLGCNSRIAALVALVCQVTIKHESYTLSYGAYEFATIGLFFCCILPVSDSFSIKRKQCQESFYYLISYWALRLQMSIVYIAAFFEKFAGEQWHNGEAIWRALARPSGFSDDIYWIYQFPIILIIIGYSVMVSQLLYPFLLWNRRTRLYLLILIEGFHIFIAISLGLWFFSFLMLAINLGALLDSYKIKEMVEQLKRPQSSNLYVNKKTEMGVSNYLIYDKDCYFCDRLADYVKINSIVDGLKLVNARDCNDPLVINALKNFHLDKGMLLHFNGRFYYGKDALVVLNMITSCPNFIMRAMLKILSIQIISFLLYPIMKFFRVIFLRLNGFSTMKY